MFTLSDLRCEYLPQPLGIDTIRPRLSWVLNHSERAQTQSAYQIRVASSLQKLESSECDLWDTGKISSAKTLVEYGGRALASRQRCFWQVRAWDGADRPGPYSTPTWFEMGLLTPLDWQAEWIGFPAGLPGRAVFVRKTFEVTRPVERARVYICGLGLYELRLNGQKVGDRVLDPAHTDYSKRVLYTTYDVTEELHSGKNAVGVILGSGWYANPKLLLQLEIEYPGGVRESVLSGHNSFGTAWIAAPGPILENSLYGGEVYDARLERDGWDTAAGEVRPRQAREEQWVVASVVEAPGGRLSAQKLEPIRVVQTVAPAAVSRPKAGVTVFDLSQNLAGWARMKVKGEPGRRVILRFAESLYADGTVNQENLRSAAATDTYILKGGLQETWEPRFTYHGFRYIQAEGLPDDPENWAVEGRVVRSDVEPAGTFECSSDLLNRIYKMVWWTENSNLHGIPTDCPQRDERMGWLNDMGARTEEALYNFLMASFFSKWIADIEDTQDTSGAIADTAPYHWGHRPADPVSACFLMIPWMLYQYYGDRHTLAAHFSAMKRWVDYLTGRAEEHIVTYSSWGDWAPPVREGLDGSIGSSAVSRDTPGELVSTGFYYYSVRLLAQIAGVLGKTREETTYRSLAREIFNSYNARFWDESAGGYGSNNQACNALSLYFRLVPDDRQQCVLDNLVRDVMELHDGHLTTGNLCTKYLLEVLTEAGRADVACTIAMQETYPSWGYMLANGATTLWERWEHMTGGGMNSHNHPMLGSVGSWFYKALAGITPDPGGPGFERFNIRPNPVCGLSYARAALKTVRGLVEAGWEQTPEGIDLRVVIPGGSRARVSLPIPDQATILRVTEGGITIWENGEQASEVPGIFGVPKQEEGYLTFEIGAGAYKLSSAYLPKRKVI